MATSSEIRSLIERWATAVHEGDLETVLADHADDIVMFDVPAAGERRARASTPIARPGLPSSSGSARGAVFEIVSLDVTAGAEVRVRDRAASLRNPGGAQQDPDNRLRLTLGLRKEGGRWVVVHEHHSFPDKS